MKILLVANTDWYLYNFRLSLAKFLREEGHEVVLVSPKGPFFGKIQGHNFRVVEWNVSRSGMNLLSEVAHLVSLFKTYQNEKPDLVHHFTIKPVLYGTIAAQIASIPRVVNSITGLGYVFLDNKPAIVVTRRLVTWLYRWLFRRQNLHLLFENDDDRKFFIQHRLITKEKSSTVQGVGIDIEKFHYIPEQTGVLPLIVFPSRMLLDKGLGVLLEAVNKIREQADVRVALVGNVDLGNPATVSENAIRDWERQGLVEWWGFRNDMDAVFQQSHIVTLPSFGEGLPTSLIEATASGRAIVTTDVPGCRDVVTNGVNGMLVPPHDSDALASALVSLIENPDLRAKMGTAGRQIAEERFSGVKINRQIYSIYTAIDESP